MLRLLVQTVNPRHEHILNGIRHGNLCQGTGQDVLFSVVLYGIALLQCLQHLLDKKRIAFGLLYDQRFELSGEPVGCQESLGHLDAVCRGQRWEGDTRKITCVRVSYITSIGTRGLRLSPGEGFFGR